MFLLLAAPVGESFVHRFRHIGVGLSRTATDTALIRYATMIARLGTAEQMRCIHVLPGAAEAVSDADQKRVRADVQGDFSAISSSVQVNVDVLRGPLTDQLLAHVTEQKVDLLFVGHRRDHPGRYALARRLAMKAPCSVWLVPEGSPAVLRRILVPIDFSEHSADTLRVATSMAHLYGLSECLALHIYHNENVITYEEHERVLRGQEREAFRKFLEPIDTHGVQVNPLFEEGTHPGQTIARIAEREEADLIVMATRGRSRSAAILLGSVTEEMIMQTRVPLLAVKHFGARLSMLQALLDRKFWHSESYPTN